MSPKNSWQNVCQVCFLRWVQVLAPNDPWRGSWNFIHGSIWLESLKMLGHIPPKFHKCLAAQHCIDSAHQMCHSPASGHGWYPTHPGMLPSLWWQKIGVNIEVRGTNHLKVPQIKMCKVLLFSCCWTVNLIIHSADSQWREKLGVVVLQHLDGSALCYL